MSEGVSTVRLGDEDDEHLVDRLNQVVAELGGQVRNERRSSGAPPTPSWVVLIGEARLAVTSEPDEGLLISGPTGVVREILSRLRSV